MEHFKIRISVIHNKTGILFNKQTADCLAEAINNFDSNRFNPHEIRKHAEQFSTERFKNEIKSFIEEEYSKHMARQ